MWDTCTGSAFLEPVRLMREEHQSFQLRGHFPHSDTRAISLFVGESRLSLIGAALGAQPGVAKPGFNPRPRGRITPNPVSRHGTIDRQLFGARRVAVVAGSRQGYVGLHGLRARARLARLMTALTRGHIHRMDVEHGRDIPNSWSELSYSVDMILFGHDSEEVTVTIPPRPLTPALAG